MAQKYDANLTEWDYRTKTGKRGQFILDRSRYKGDCLVYAQENVDREINMIEQTVRSQLGEIPVRNPYEAVTVDQLVARLGSMCSPANDRRGNMAGYVIGPDINGRICHCATCFSIGEARQHAAKLNVKQETPTP